MTRATIASGDYELLPHDAEAEKIVVGALLVDPDAMPRVQEVGLKHSDFHNQGYRWIVESAEALASRGEPIELISVSDELTAQSGLEGDRLAAIGGMPALASIMNNVGPLATVGYYAERIVRCSRRRRLIAAGAQISADAHMHDGELGDLYGNAISTLFGAIDDADDDAHLTGGREAVERYRKGQMARKERLARDPNALLKTYWPSVDHRLGDFQEGQLIIIAASTSVGKTMAMEQIAEANAMRGHKIIYYHLELSHQSMLDRCVARHSSVKVQELRQGENGPKVERALDEIAQWQQNIIYVHCPGWTADRIAADIIRYQARGLCDMAVVDYLQKIAIPDVRGDARNYAQLVGGKVEILKNAAERSAIPIVLGSQVNRDYKTNANKRPTLEGLRDSGEIAEKANVVMILHNPKAREERDDTDESELIELYIEKSTDGPLGKADLVHLKGKFLLGEAYNPIQGKAQPRPSAPRPMFADFADDDDDDVSPIPF